MNLKVLHIDNVAQHVGEATLFDGRVNGRCIHLRKQNLCHVHSIGMMRDHLLHEHCDLVVAVHSGVAQHLLLHLAVNGLHTLLKGRVQISTQKALVALLCTAASKNGDIEGATGLVLIAIQARVTRIWTRRCGAVDLIQQLALAFDLIALRQGSKRSLPHGTNCWGPSGQTCRSAQCAPRCRGRGLCTRRTRNTRSLRRRCSPSCKAWFSRVRVAPHPRSIARLTVQHAAARIVELKDEVAIQSTLGGCRMRCESLEPRSRHGVGMFGLQHCQTTSTMQGYTESLVSSTGGRLKDSGCGPGQGFGFHKA